MTKEEARKIIEEWGRREPLMSEEDAIKLYYEAREEIKKWEQIERRLKKLGLE